MADRRAKPRTTSNGGARWQSVDLPKEYEIVSQSAKTMKVAIGTAIATMIAAIGLGFTAVEFFADRVFATKPEIGEVKTSIAAVQGEQKVIATEQKTIRVEQGEIKKTLDRNYKATRLTNKNMGRLLRSRRIRPATEDDLEPMEEE